MLRATGKNTLLSSNIRLLFLIIFTICLGVFCVSYQPSQTKEKKDPVKSHRYIPSKPRVEITGLDYDLDFQGEKNLNIKADRFVIRKRKLGFIRFGLAREAFFQNAEISFFSNSAHPSPVDKPNTNKATSFFKIQEAGAAEQATAYLDSLDKILPSSEVKRLSSVVMAPISISFFDGINEISLIKASKATFQARGKEFVLTGNVTITAGEKHIRTNRLIFLTEKQEIYIPGSYFLETAGEKKRGGHIISDIALSSVSI